MNFFNAQIKPSDQTEGVINSGIFILSLLSTDFTNSKEYYLNARLKEILFAINPVVCR